VQRFGDNIVKIKLFLAFLLFPLSISPANAAEVELRISKQYGISHFLLTVVKEHQLIEKRMAAAKMKNVRVKWLTFDSGTATINAFDAGQVNVISLGVGPFLRLWERTNGNVKGIAAIDQAPLKLNMSRPAVQGLEDLNDKDRIAVPAVKISISALLLQMAAAKQFGIKNYAKYDHLTVSGAHPDAALALTSDQSTITGHFASEPFSTIELKSPNIHTVLNSYDILGGNHIFNLVAASEDFYNKHPELIKVVMLAMDDAGKWINSNKRAAAELYVKASRINEPVELIYEVLQNPQIVYDITPVKITAFSDFLYEIGVLKRKPASWKELFLPLIHDRSGS
jgi:NitT/TauT family transport system substrate-binding protein